MKIDKPLSGPLCQVVNEAKESEEAGYDGLYSTEAAHDVLLPLAVAATSTARIQLRTEIAVAFARTPMTTAYSSWDIHNCSHGRFSLGLGSQVRAHIKRRMSTPWSHPAPRMREYVSALRAIWTAWQQDGTRLNFQGNFYTHTLMTTMFDPGPCAYDFPTVHVAGVGERMVRVVAEIGDGLVVHPFTTEQYARQAILPIVEDG